MPERFTDILSKGIDYKILTENIPVFDIIAGVEHATKNYQQLIQVMHSALIVVTF